MRASSERGSILILTAISTVVLLSVAALAIDASFMFDLKNRLSAVADSAALSAAYEIKRGNSANMATFAHDAVDRATTTDHLVPAGVVVDAHLCDAAGATCTAPTNTNRFVEVILAHTHPTFFSSIMGFLSLTPRARAVAGTATPRSCLIAMNKLTMGTSAIDLNGCAVQVGGDLTGTTPQAHIDGPALVTGDCDGTSCTNGEFTDVNDEAVYPSNPFDGLGPPLVSGSCGLAAADPLPPGCYTSIPGTIHHLQAGVFKVTGELAIDTELRATDGTLIYLTSTGHMEGNNGVLEVVASNTIAGYEGIAIYGDSGAQLNYKNGFHLRITGAIDFADADAEFKNNLTIEDTGCTVMVFRNLEFKNGTGAILSSDGCAAQFSNAAYNGVALSE